MFDIFNNVNAATYSREESTTLFNAGKAVYGYSEMMNMEPAPFGYAPRKAERTERRSLRKLISVRRAARPIYADHPMMAYSGR